MIVPNHGGPPPQRGFLTAPGWDGDTRRELEAMVVSNPGAVAAFDFDDTILDGDISEAMLADLASTRGEDLVTVYEQDCSIRGKRFGYAKLVETLLVGRTEVEVRAHTRVLLGRGLRDGTLRYRPPMLDLIWAMQRHGWEVWVVTASPAIIVATAAQHAGLGADRVLGMWCATDENARFTAPTREPVTFRHGKVEAFCSATDGAVPLFATGDAITDLEMLCQARYALVIDRGDPDLLTQAASRSWWVQGGL